MTFYNFDTRSPRHAKPVVGPWRGIETNIIDKTNSLEGACQVAENLIFERFKPGAGTPTPARVRPGRRAWNTDTLWPRFYLTEGASAEDAWTLDPVGSFSAVQAKAGYQSLLHAPVASAVYTSYRVFPTPKDVTQGNQTATLALQKIYMSYRLETTQSTSIKIKLTSDVAPGAPAGWVDYLELTVNTSISALGTWLTFSQPLTSGLVTKAGTFAGTAAQIQASLAAITAVAVIVDGINTSLVYVDEVFLEAQAAGHIVGLGSFTKATTQNQYLLAKAGETLYVDANSSKAFTKVKSGLDMNAPAYFAAQYNQIFMADGNEVTVFDAASWATGGYKSRVVGFPAPNLAGTTGSAVAGGTDMTAGNHFLSISYIYGEGSDRYGQSNATVLLPAVTIAAGQKLRVSGLPVPDAQAGVIKKRIYVGLADASQYATNYFALELDPSDTDTIAAGDIDISDADLTAPLNPVGPVDNDVPPVCRYLIPYEGSLIYLRLSTNPAALGYSRRGSDLNSGPEVVPLVNIAVNQRGEAWTGGIVRNGAVYLFTRKSIHIGKFTALGILNVTQLDGFATGASESIGAVDQNAIWKDDENNIIFKSDAGEYVLDPSDRIIPLAKRAMKDEYKDCNDLDAINTFAYRSVTSEADWNEGAVGGNLATADVTGSLTYKYPKNATVPAPVAYVPTALNAVADRANGLYAPAGFPNGIIPAGTAPVLQVGEEMGVLMQADSPLLLSKGTLSIGPGQIQAPSAAVTATLTMRIKKYKYQNGRSMTSSGTANIGSTIQSVTVVSAAFQSGRQDPTTVTFNLTPLFIPQGEMFWVTWTLDACAVPITFAGGVNKRLVHVASPTTGFASNLTMASTVQRLTGAAINMEVFTGGSLNGQPFGMHTTFTYTTLPATYTFAQTNVNFATLPNFTLQRVGRVELLDNTSGDPIDYANLGALGALKVYVEVQDPTTLSWINQTLMEQRLYGIPNNTPVNSANNFFTIPDYRPLATYPGATLTQYLDGRVTVEGSFAGNYGYDITSDAMSRISTDLETTFGNSVDVKLSWSAETSFASEPYTSDIWTSAAIDTVNPASWGKFVMDAVKLQQFVSLQARTDNNAAMSNNNAWNDILPNSVPSTTDLPILGQYLQLRIIFRDDEVFAVSSGASSEIRSLTVAWQLATDGRIRPIVPPAGCFFNDYHLVAYTPASARTNSLAWCLSPGFKYSKWTNQTVNCWLVHEKTLLAGMAGNGKVTEYWRDDYLDDGVTPIAGTLRTQVLACGSSNIKSFSGLEIFTGVTEYMGASLSTDVAPMVGLGTPGDEFFINFESASPDRSLDTPAPYYTLAPLIAGAILSTPNRGGYVRQKYDAPTHNDPDARIPALAQSYFFDIALQDAYVMFTWQAYAHQLDRRDLPGAATLPKVNRFPYLTMIQPQFYIENISGIHGA